MVGCANGAEIAMSRRLVAHVLQALYYTGFHYYFAAGLTMKEQDKDTLYFRPGPSVSRTMFSVSFNEGDKIRLIDSPSQEITTAFSAAVLVRFIFPARSVLFPARFSAHFPQSWPSGVKGSKETDDNCLRYKLNGYPWYTSDGAEVNHARMLGCTLLSSFEEKGFELIASIDQSMGSGTYMQDSESSMNSGWIQLTS